MVGWPRPQKRVYEIITWVLVVYAVSSQDLKAGLLACWLDYADADADADVDRICNQLNGLGNTASRLV